MAKQIIKKIESTCVPLNIENIDTDQIVPSRFLKATTRVGFGDNLFRDWRYDNNNNPVKDFVLNDPVYKGEILVAGDNFGCGSSREHAAWAIQDFGFKAIVSSSFADIFKNNALNNNLLPVTVSPEFLQNLFIAIKNNPKTSVTINIPEQTISFENNIEHFDINHYKKECFIKGLDDVEYLLSFKKDIEKFEEKRNYE